MQVKQFLIFLFFLPSIHSFAAKKKGGKNAAARSSSKGFGAAPPTLDQVLQQFKTRVPTPKESDLNALDCPCGSGNIYGDCCAPLHSGHPCETMTQVLQSRYSAFCWRLIGHIIRTTHETCRDYQLDAIAWAKDLNQNGMFDSYEFVGLKILEPEQQVNENEGTISFAVTLRGKENAATGIAGKESIISETSTFRKENGGWLYASGVVKSEEAGLEGAVLNN